MPPQRLTTFVRYRIEPYSGPVTWSEWREAYTLTSHWRDAGRVETHRNPIRQYLTLPEGRTPTPRHRGKPRELWKGQPTGAPYEPRRGYFTPLPLAAPL